MQPEEATRHVSELYEHLLQRSPGEQELRNWAEHLLLSNDPVALFRKMVSSKEYLARTRVRCLFPSGHFYSPVVDPAAAAPYYRKSVGAGIADLQGVDVNEAASLAFWEANLPIISSSAFTLEARPDRRFRIADAPFPWGDAVVLRAMIWAHRPKRIIEIGSGFSTACMLDAADEFGLHDLKVTCVEPNAERLHSLLWPGDESRITLRQSLVQDVPLDVFRELGPGDFLFIDSTHVLKTGSDVHYELFEILPALAPGVLIHFHDCPFPFEYPRHWVTDLNHSWNEVYVLRAFLTDNPLYRIAFWCSLLSKIHNERFLAAFPGAAEHEFMRAPGSGIWIEKTGDTSNIDQSESLRASLR